MHLIEQDEHIVTREASMHWPHPWVNAIALDEEPRAKLINRRRNHHRLIGCPRPAIVLRDAASQCEHSEWFLIRSAEQSKRLPNRDHFVHSGRGECGEQL